ITKISGPIRPGLGPVRGNAPRESKQSGKRVSSDGLHRKRLSVQTPRPSRGEPHRGPKGPMRGGTSTGPAKRLQLAALETTLPSPAGIRHRPTKPYATAAPPSNEDAS